MAEDVVVPSGISSLDSQVRGGFPPGSLVILVSDIGAGGKEFAMTSAMMIQALKEEKIQPVSKSEVKIPDKCWWITFTRPREDILNEVSMSFDEELVGLYEEIVEFKDFSDEYFQFSSVPADWISKSSKGAESADSGVEPSEAFSDLTEGEGVEADKSRRLLEKLAAFLTENASDNLVVFHSLTDLARLYGDKVESWYDFTLFLRGLQRASKEWKGLILADFSRGLFQKERENEVSACGDGVISFRWESAGATGKRRVMCFDKFRGLLPRMDGASATKFQVDVTPSSGFEIASAELIEGLER